LLFKQIFFTALGIVLVCPALPAQEEEFKRGLPATYQSSEGPPVERIDADLMFDWRDGPLRGVRQERPLRSDRNDGAETPSQPPVAGPDRSVPLPFQAKWEGQVLIRSLTPYRFHAEVCGELLVTVGGRSVLEAKTDQPAWISGEEVELDPGFQEIEVTYHSTESAALVKLFWSSETFALEPVPPHLLFHEQDETHINLVERGRQLFEAHRCHRCHAGPLERDEFPAPPLWGITSGTNPEWIVEKLLGKEAGSAHAKMPRFNLSQEEAEDVAMYLHRLGAPHDLVTAPDVKPSKNGPTPNELLYATGCLACHTVGELGQQGPYAGGDLSLIADKRSPDWLNTWLSSPEKINPQHRMPAFKLNRTERGLLVQALSKLGEKEDISYGFAEHDIPTPQVNRGRELVKQFQCANCHKIPAVEASPQEYASLKEPVQDWDASCLSEEPDDERQRPHYPQLDREALRAYLEANFETPEAPLSKFEQGRLVLERKNCLNCHARGTGQGFLETAGKVAMKIDELQGQSQVLIPPSLNAVGDKLRDEVLDKALSGNQDRIRADWLKIQMPRFKHSREELAALKTYLVSRDRIPDAGQPDLPTVDLPPDEILVTGRRLIGAGGFSCIACHQVGDYVPKNVALGTRGSDLLGIANRLRPEFYFRWTKAPIQIVPGMEMPSYQKPVPGVLDEDVNRQLAVLWEALHDDRFEAPSDPSQVEQLWLLTEHDPARIVRDVFTVAEENGGGTLPRAFAVGLPNQHALLFDLDFATVREWRFGDFAQQRTVGKSWYWDLAGTHVATGFTPETEFLLVHERDGAEVPLQQQHPDRLARLTEYRVDGEVVDLWHEIDTLLEDQLLTIRVNEIIRPVQDDSRSGIGRRITAENIPDGYRLGIKLPELDRQFGAEVVVRESADGDEPALTVTYTSSIVPPVPTPIDRPVVLASDAPVTTLPGYDGVRLKLPTSIMPTAITFDADGHLVFTSLKGQVYRALDMDGDGIEDSLQRVEEGLAAPFGILTDGNDLLVAHKPELLRLAGAASASGRRESPDDSHLSDSGPVRSLTTHREVVADGWGYTDDYHDWTTGPVRDREGNLFLATASDYAQRNRPESQFRWRGKVLKLDTSGNLTPYAHELRYPIGIAFDAQDRLFVSDQQGVQNTFNEINHIVKGGRYGVPGKGDDQSKHPGPDGDPPPAVQIPHPWTRSVNGIFFLPENDPGPFAGHGIGCEFNSKFLIRFTTQEVDGVLQGATYPFSKTEWSNEAETFLGPICGAVGPEGDIYIGSLYDSGWLGGQNTGEIVRLRRSEDPLPNGIREIRAIPGGFEIEFIREVDPRAAQNPESYSLSGYTRVWQGSYGTDDSGRYSPEIASIQLADDRRTVRLHAGPLKTGFVYELNVRNVTPDGEPLFPAYGTYTLNHLAQ
jgi:mono/diheme cytochrome c family protein